MTEVRIHNVSSLYMHMSRDCVLHILLFIFSTGSQSSTFIQVSHQEGSGDVLSLGEILVPGLTPLAALEAKEDGPALFLKSWGVLRKQFGTSRGKPPTFSADLKSAVC